MASLLLVSLLFIVIPTLSKPGARNLWLHAPGFLKSFLFARRYLSVCVSICVSAPEGINNHWHDQCDIGHLWLVKPIVLLFRILPLINWKSVTLVTQYIMHSRQRCRSWCCTSHKRRCISYLAVATRCSALVIKVSGESVATNLNEG